MANNVHFYLQNLKSLHQKLPDTSLLFSYEIFNMKGFPSILSLHIQSTLFIQYFMKNKYVDLKKILHLHTHILEQVKISKKLTKIHF